jgi:DNA-binding NtrC family response regulator
VIAATSQDLEDAIVRGEFRPDLYDRLNVVEIQVPPLRERPEEIPALVAEFLAKFNAQYGRSKEISPAAMGRLIERPWPGNVRELENVIRRLVVLDREQALDAVVGEARGVWGRRCGARARKPEEVGRRGAAGPNTDPQDVLERVRWSRAGPPRFSRSATKRSQQNRRGTGWHGGRV